MKRLSLEMALLICAPLLTSAQQSAPNEKERLIMEIISVGRTSQASDFFFDTLMSAYIEMIPEVTQDQSTAFDSAPPELRRDLIALMNETTKRVALRTKERVLADEQLRDVKKQIAIKVWSQGFSEVELAQLLAFLGTPLGQKFVDVGPLAAAEVSNRAKEFGPRINEIFQAVRAEELEKAFERVRELERKHKVGKPPGSEVKP